MLVRTNSDAARGEQFQLAENPRAIQIYNGDGKAQSGIEWTRQSEERFRMVENGARLIPDQALLQSWTRQPDHVLPKKHRGTMTWLVNQYVDWKR
jgi:hypothetical protein